MLCKVYAYLDAQKLLVQELQDMKRRKKKSGPFNPHTKEKWSQEACKESF